MKALMRYPSLLLFIFTAVACYDQMQLEDLAAAGPYFPRISADAAAPDRMEAVLSGTLVFRNHCFLLQASHSGELYTPVWPAGFDFRLLPDSSYAILNAAGNEVARSGLGIRISGGELEDARQLTHQIEGGPGKLLLSCPAPYWLVGEEVQVVEPEAGLPAHFRNELGEWFDFYAAHIDDWRISAFRISDKWQLDSLPLTEDAKGVYPIAGRPAAWLRYSPDDRYNLDLYAKDVLMPEEGDQAHLRYAFSLHPEVALEDLASGERRSLLSCEKNCRFETSFWENDDAMVIAGLQRDKNSQFHPTVWRVSLKDLTVRQYTYPTPLVAPFPYNYVEEVVFAAY